MNRGKAFLAVLAALLVGSVASAQSKVPLTVIASEGPAQVILNGRVLGVANPSLTVQFAPGRYELIVRKPGKPDFKQNIELGPRGLTVQAQLGAPARPLPPPQPVKQLFTLTVTSNVNGARVAVNGSSIGGAPARTSLEPGRYTVTVEAPGYDGFTAQVSVNGNETVHANLRQRTNRLSVGSNVGGAEVFINNVRAGNAPFSAELAPGSYNLRVAAPGYQDFNTTIVMNGPQNVTANLAPLFSTVTVSGPGVELFVDGGRIGGQSVQVQPGSRRIRVVAGALSAELVLNVEPGRSYTIEPALSLSVR